MRCDSDGSITQTFTLFNDSFQVNPRTVLETEKNVKCKNNLRYLSLMPT